MRVGITIKGLAEVQDKLRGLASGKLNVAIKAALNDAAHAGYEAGRNEMRRVFDRPTPWVLGGIRYIKATASKLEARIDFDHWGNKTLVTVADVLQAEIDGGQRRYKRHESALRQAGILPAGMFIVPGTAAERDAYGNMKGSQIVQILAWFRTFGEQGYRANMTDKGRARLGRDSKRTGRAGFQYFVLKQRHGKLLPGIYKRHVFSGGSSAVKPVMIFVRSPNYRKRFDFYGVTREAALEQFHRSFPFWLNRLLKEGGR